MDCVNSIPQEMQGQMSPQSRQDYPRYSSPSSHSQPPPDVVNSPIEDGVYFAVPSPRNSMSTDVNGWGSQLNGRGVDNCKKNVL